MTSYFTSKRWIFFVCIGFIFLLGYMMRLFTCHRLSCFHIDQMSKWKLQDVYEEHAGEVFRGLYSMDSEVGLVRVDVRDEIEEETAHDYIGGKIAGMKALYANIRSPYPGLISDEISCDEEFTPTYSTLTTKSGTQVQTVTGYLNDRLVFGACTKDQITHRGMMLLFFCPKHAQLYQIEFIEPVSSFLPEKFNDLTQSIRCK